MPATTTTWTPGPYTRLPYSALATALRRRMAGQSWPTILRHLEGSGWDCTGYTPNLLNNHTRQYGVAVGAPLPERAARRTGARRTGARRFGVEIECKGLRSEAAAAALRAAGLDAQAESYNHRVGRAWKVTTDASLSGVACEVVSPPLDDPAQVTKAMDALRAAGATVDLQCGLHVHHEVTDLSGEALGRLVEMYAGHQGTLDSLVSRSRRGGQWAAHFRNGEADALAYRFRRAIRDGDDATARRRAAAAEGIGGRPQSRYRVLNVHSYGTYGTLEFRQHQGTLSGRKAEAWIALGRAMIQAAAAGTDLAADRFLADLRDGGHLSATDHDFLAGRALALAS